MYCKSQLAMCTDQSASQPPGSSSLLVIQVHESNVATSEERVEDWQILVKQCKNEHSLRDWLSYHLGFTKHDEDPGGPGHVWSMGIYVFTFEVLRGLLQEDARQSSNHDFGRDILPGLLNRYRLVAFPFMEGIGEEPAYWRDVGTVDAYWQAHMDLLGPQPQFCLDQPVWPLHMVPVHQPPTIVRTPLKLCATGGWVTTSVIAPGCVHLGERIEHSILAPGVCIHAEAEVTESILFDGVRIGQGARIRHAILEHEVGVPPGTYIGYQSGADEGHFTVSEGGITVVDYSLLRQVPVAQTHSF
jgi:glucose-1-phosphate adenylyltransferase